MFTQPIDVPTVRDELRLALGRPDPPHTLLRLGYAAPTTPTPRRPTGEIIASQP
jgi:hypothetical protein